MVSARRLRRDEVGQRSETVRRSNLSAIVRELHYSGPLTRSELVTRTGLTRSAIRGLIGELAAADVVSEGPSPSVGTPGRPSTVVTPNAERTTVLALDILVDSSAATLVGLGGTILQHQRMDRPRRHFAVDDVVADLAELAGAVRARQTASDDVIGVGVAVVGMVRRSDGFVSMAPNLGWRDVALGARLAEALATTAPIFVANEADLGALAEVRRGVSGTAGDVLFISGEVGVGGGLIVGGEPLTGMTGYGGEIGHMPINPNGLPCRCGSTGCWETEVGEGALLRRAGRPVDGGSAAIDALLRDAAAGLPLALAALDEEGRWLGLGLAGLINVFNPRQIVLGGLIGRIHPFVADKLERELDRQALPGPRDIVRIVPASLGQDAPLLGAAELAFEPFLSDPGAWIGPRGAASSELLGASA